MPHSKKRSFVRSSPLAFIVVPLALAAVTAALLAALSFALLQPYQMMLGWFFDNATSSQPQDLLANAGTVIDGGTAAEAAAQPESIPFSSITYPTVGDRYATITISGTNVDAPVYYGDANKILNQGVGTYMENGGAGLPGEGKTILLAGHNNTFFNDLQHAEEGATVTITTHYGVYTYEVTGTEILDYQDKSSKKRASHRRLFLVGKDAPFQFVEAYKSLRTNLEFLSATSNCKTILITSSVPEEGKSNVAINLAMTLATSNKRVILVDCDMRKSAISRYLRIPRNRPGLTNVITSKDVSTLPDSLVRLKDHDITVLPVGTIPPNPAELLSTPIVERIFSALQQAYDYVIVDTPPVSVVTDAAVLSRVADGVVLVVRPGVTTIQGAQLSKKNLEAVNAHILGVVMNGYNAKKTGRKDGYSYAYSYGYYDTKQDSSDE